MRLLLSFMAFSGCSPSLDSLVEDHIAETGLDYVDCDSVRPGNCDTSFSASQQCFLDAFQICTAAEIRVNYTSVEGDAVPAHYFVEPLGNSCFVSSYNDYSEDAFKGDYGDYSYATCDGLEQSEEDAECVWFVPEGCTTQEEWGPGS